MNKRLSIRLILSMFSVGTFCPSIMAGTATPKQKTDFVGYQEIGNSYINSFGVVEVPAVEPLKENKKLDLSIPTFSPQEKRQMLFELMARNETGAEGLAQIIDALRITLKDLDVYYGNGKNAQETLMSKINNTQTIFGDAALAHLLSQVTSDTTLLQKRQDFIKELLSNDQLFNALDSIFAKTKQAESGFFSYLRQNDPVSEQLFKDLYFAKSGLNKFNDSSVALEGLTRLGNLGTTWKIAGDAVFLIGFNYVISKVASYGARKMDSKDRYGKPVIVPDTFVDALKTSYTMVKSFIDPRDYISKDMDSEMANAVMRGEMSADQAATTKKVFRIVGYIKPAFAAGILSYKAYLIKGAIDQAKQTKDAINYLHTRLNDVATIVDSCKQLDALAQKNPIMAQGVSSIDDLKTLFDKSQSSDFIHLIDLLQTSTFKGSASFFSLSGRVLAANKLMTTEVENFAPALAALGEIEACLSLAKLCKKMEHERVGYCFVDFVNKDKPYMNISNFWNPFVDPNVVVTNSLKLGEGADASKIILTGSNTGGKSTVLKAIMMSLLLAHTCGIAPAQAMSISPFDFIGSYLRVNDDTAADQSKFKAEVMRAKMLCETMDALPADKFGFIVIDELFTGTGSEKAANAASKVAQKLAGLENNLYILATHFPLLTELEKTNQGLIKNYKIDVLKDDAGNLVRTYKLEEGISNSNVANDILNEQIQDIDFDI